MVSWFKRKLRVALDFLYKIYTIIIDYNKEKEFQSKISDGSLVIGKYSYGRPIIKSCRGENSKVIIGKFCSIAGNVRIFTGCNHNPKWVSTYPFRIMFSMDGAYNDGQPSTKGNVVIGNDVWIGGDTTIVSGVKIGDGCIVATGAVVTRDLPPYSIAAGVPAKVVKSRFDDETIERLLKIKWWDWDIEKIKENVDLLSSNKIEEFLNSHYITNIREIEFNK